MSTYSVPKKPVAIIVSLGIMIVSLVIYIISEILIDGIIGGGWADIEKIITDSFGFIVSLLFILWIRKGYNAARILLLLESILVVVLLIAVSVFYYDKILDNGGLLNYLHNIVGLLLGLLSTILLFVPSSSLWFKRCKAVRLASENSSEEVTEI